MLIDGCNRKVDYLRISLTDKCNLRCKYCVPSCGVERMEHSEILTFEEVLRIVEIMTKLGITKIRFTGGEPLVRKGMISLIQNVSKLPDAPKICLTTNGVLLSEYIDYLYYSSVHDINISLDTLDPLTYESITGEDAIALVFDSIRECLNLGVNLKINAVPLKGINEEDIPALASLARDNNITVRFIELMPVGCAVSYTGISNDEVRRILDEVYGESKPVESEGGPSTYVAYDGFQGKIGFISPMSHAFCSSCNRLRLTCDGKLKLCLASPMSLDLKALLRNGASDEDISHAIEKAVLTKPAHHEFNSDSFTPDDRNMIGIGG